MVETISDTAALELNSVPVERREVVGKLLWARYRFRAEGSGREMRWVSGKKEIKGQNGSIAIGHFTGPALVKEIAASASFDRFIWMIEGSFVLDGETVDTNKLVFLPTGFKREIEIAGGEAWVIELSPTEREKKSKEPIFVDLEPVKKEGSAQWIGPWVDENLPPTIHIALEGGSIEAPKYAETHHRHDKTIEFYAIGQGRTVASFVSKDDELPEVRKRVSQARTKGGLRRDTSAALFPGDLLVIYPSDAFYHAEPAPRYSGIQRSLAIKWMKGLPVDTKDKILHPRVEVS